MGAPVIGGHVPRIVVIDYGMGNLRSVTKAFRRIDVEAELSDRPEVIRGADRLVLPGVGAFGDGMKNLRERGLIEPIIEAVTRKGRPILGICLGMELLARDSDEGGFNEGLGLVPASVRRLDGAGGLRIPHVGWNDIRFVRPNPLTDGFADGTTFYFVHSYVMRCDDSRDVTGETEYGEVFASVIQRGIVFGFQGHPEKSQKNGRETLSRFARARID